MVSICLWRAMQIMRFADTHGLQMVCLLGRLQGGFMQLRWGVFSMAYRRTTVKRGQCDALSQAQRHDHPARCN